MMNLRDGKTVSLHHRKNDHHGRNLYEDAALGLQIFFFGCEGGNSGTGEALKLAAWDGKTKEVKDLLARGADVNYRDPVAGLTPLHMAAEGGHPETAHLLIREGADVNAAGESVGSPLFFAALGGHESVVDLLLEAGSEVNAAVVDGSTPLSAAATMGHLEVVKQLMKAGADPQLATDAGETPADAARRKGRDEIARWIEQY